MADEEHLSILKQGVEVWNQWCLENREITADFSGADLRRADLRRALLGRANLRRADVRKAILSKAILRLADVTRADLSGADLSGADLSGADLCLAILCEANLRGANLREADLSRANLDKADLREADLCRANLRETRLGEANLFKAYLSRADLSGANLSMADLSRAEVGYTVFGDLDLSRVKGLETVFHEGPSTVGVNTLSRSRGKIPETFLRGCGLNEWEVESAKLYRSDIGTRRIMDILYNIHHMRAHQAIQINPLFISYSPGDSPFVDYVEGYLNDRGIRFWRDIHHATAGHLERQIDRAMRLNPTVLLILSEHSTESDWVEHEARLARELEKELGRDVLCPVALDDSWKTCRWSERLREQIIEYNILDFSNWRDEPYFQRTFTKLIDGLDLFYKE